MAKRKGKGGGGKRRKKPLTAEQKRKIKRLAKLAQYSKEVKSLDKEVRELNKEFRRTKSISTLKKARQTAYRVKQILAESKRICEEEGLENEIGLIESAQKKADIRIAQLNQLIQRRTGEQN